MRVRRRRSRVGPVVLIIFVALIAFTVRLVDIQVVSAASLRAEAEEKRAHRAPVYGARGNIVDANGAVLADSVERYSITTSPRVALTTTDRYGPLEPKLEEIAKITGQSAAELMMTIASDPESDYAVLADDLTLDQYEAIDALEIPWLYAVRVPARSYPNGAIAGNIVGFLGKDEPLAGLERSMDQCLAGQDGLVAYERSEDGVRIPGTEVTEVPAKDGGTLKLTIDRDLQWYVQERAAKAALQFNAMWAEAIVVRIADGAIMAVTDWPTVDPNNFTAADPSATGSRAFAIPYEPGSIMKPFTMAMVLDQGLATPSTPMYSPPQMDFGGDAGILNDWGGHEANLTMAGVLAVSSNTGTAQFATMLDEDLRYEYMERFGFGEPTAIDFSGESGGYLPPTQDWDPRTTLNISFGQGVSTTIAQMGGAYQALGNQGLRLPLKLVENCTLPDGTVIEPERGEPVQAVSSVAAQQTVHMMEMVYKYGGSRNDLTIPGYRIAAKSGTAQWAEEDGSGYKDKTVISYAGIVPADQPQYAIVVSLGMTYQAKSSWLATTLRDIAAETLTTFRVMPSGTEAPDIPINY